MNDATTPSAVTRDAALLALLPSFTRSSSSARAMSPSASVSAFLHSIIGASVFARSSATMLARNCRHHLLLEFRLCSVSTPPALRCRRQEFGCSRLSSFSAPTALRQRRSGRRLKKGPFAKAPFFAGHRAALRFRVDLDELVAVAAAGGLHDFVDRVGTAFQDRVGHAVPRTEATALLASSLPGIT